MVEVGGVGAVTEADAGAQHPPRLALHCLCPCLRRCL
jgi:hypothetical protein